MLARMLKQNIDWLGSITQVTYHTGKNMDKKEHCPIVAENENLYSHYGNQYGSTSDNWESMYHKTQINHSGSLNVVKPNNLLGSECHYQVWVMAKSSQYHDCYKRLHIETLQELFQPMTVIEVRLNTF